MNGNYQVGDLLPKNNWRLTRLIGEGTYGCVYEAKSEDEYSTDESVAIKIITIPKSESEIIARKNDGLNDASVTTYFRTVLDKVVEEVKLMAKLKGKTNLVSYESHFVIPHESGVGWDIFIVMELLTPLMAYAQVNPLRRRDVIKLGIDICHALDICQKYDIIHRDIKPDNIFVSSLGDFVLGDFGVARFIGEASVATKAGTYAYMAPEVARGENYTSKVDMYALGLVMYRFVNGGREPFLPDYPETFTHPDVEAARAYRIKGIDMPAPINATKKLSDIILKSTAFNPEDRYSTPFEMEQKLKAILGEEEPSPIVYPADKAAKTSNNNSEAILISGSNEEGTINIFGVDKSKREPAPVVDSHDNLPPPPPPPPSDSLSDSEGNSKRKKGPILGICAVAAVVITGGIIWALNTGLELDSMAESTPYVHEYTDTGDEDLEPEEPDVEPYESEEPDIDLREYDDLGRLIIAPIYDENNILIGWTGYEYHNDSNNIRSIRTFDAEMLIQAHAELREDGTIWRSWIAKHDSFRNLISLLRFDETEALDWSQEFRFDEEYGHRISTTNSWFSDDGNLIRTEVYEFRESGSIETKSYIEFIDGEEKLRRTRGFDDNSNLIRDVTINDDLSKLVIEFDFNEDNEETERREIEVNAGGTVVRTNFFRPGESEPFRTDPPRAAVRRPTTPTATPTEPVQQQPDTPCGRDDHATAGGLTPIDIIRDERGWIVRRVFQYSCGCKYEIRDSDHAPNGIPRRSVRVNLW